PESLAVIDCPCRAARGDEGCLPRDVCLVLGEPWVSFVMAYGEDSHPRQITQEEAVEICERQHAAGNVQAIFWKESQNNRTYAICNCCICCCTALQAYNYVHTPMLAGSGYKCLIDGEKCNACGKCAGKCKFFALKIENHELLYDEEKCLGCGVCVRQCPNGAVSLRQDNPSACEPLDVEKLIPLYQRQ
ncbi:MAG: 4Fe-4S binding protein, partial [Gracilibacteraceae bacterium]|nr:4Fe-4S binding protein [Gracilibacteraceae bacterium]